MSVIRAVGHLRLVASALLHRQGTFPALKPISRNGSVIYRKTVVKEKPAIHFVGEAMSFFLWYWILYHCWFEYSHLVPEHTFPDPSSFTDEELGIPPDDED